MWFDEESLKLLLNKKMCFVIRAECWVQSGKNYSTQEVEEKI
jgi:hypothetical protein